MLMLELGEMSVMVTILLIASLAGVVSWGITQVVKLLLLRDSKNHGQKSWYNIVLRIIAMLMGAGVGYMLLSDALGFYIGLAGGVLNTTLVAVIKSKLRKYNVNVDSPDEYVVPGPHERD